ncbi:hypothetical protein V2W30_22505 [Streptomyces sp. Q6]|uniref:Uncharacterized protein n=1 Tax=Streptomyces citrinus TaxID=3118173 RepID=A0ACD5AFK0_9ACTN
MSAPLVVNTTDGTCWTRRTATRGGLALYAMADVKTCPDAVMATYDELAEHGISGTADVLPMPVGSRRCEIDRLADDLAGANLSLWEEEQDHARTRLAWQSARRRAARRQPHEREGLIFHLERENRRLHAFVRVANHAAQVSHGSWEKTSTEVASLREENARLRARVAELEAGLPAMQQALFRALDRVTELEAAPTTVYRAEHPDSGITLGHYGTAVAARAHCEDMERRSWPTGTNLAFDWIEDDEDRVAELVVTAGQNEESTTGYIVTALELASEYDEEADE